jgi:hypothetical protein
VAGEGGGRRPGEPGVARCAASGGPATRGAPRCAAACGPLGQDLDARCTGERNEGKGRSGGGRGDRVKGPVETWGVLGFVNGLGCSHVHRKYGLFYLDAGSGYTSG